MKKCAPAFFVAFAVLPLAAGLVYALLYSFGLVGILADGFTCSAWSKALTDSTLWMSMGLSVLISTGVVAISTALALGLLMLLRVQLESPRVRFLLHFPLAMPPMVAAFVSFQWLGSSGMLARAAQSGGWLDAPDAFPPLINDPFYLGVCATLTLLTFPFFLLVFLHQYKSANLLQISDLAATLGAPKAYVYRHILAPVLLHRAAPTLLLYGVFLLGAYEAPLLLGRQSPMMISVLINQKFRRFNLADIPVAYVATVVYALLVLGLLLVFLRKKGRP